MTEWLTGDAFFIVILVLCIVMHLFMHGGHGGHGGHDRQGSHDEQPRNKVSRA